jgi:hypothetical protein
MKKGGFKLLQDYLEDPTIFPKDLSNIQVCSLKTCTEKWHGCFSELLDKNLRLLFLSFLCTYFISQFMRMSSLTGPRLFQVSYLFNWEIFRKNKRFYMSSYLIFVVTYCHVFNGLTLG